MELELKTTPLNLPNPKILEELEFSGVAIPLPDLIILLQNLKQERIQREKLLKKEKRESLLIKQKKR